jgi:hypothetical protein
MLFWLLMLYLFVSLIVTIVVLGVTEDRNESEWDTFKRFIISMAFGYFWIIILPIYIIVCIIKDKL